MYDVGYAIGASASWAMVCFALYRLWRTGWTDRGRQALCGAFLFSAIGQLVEITAVAAPLNDLFAVPNLNRLIAYTCATMIGVCEAVLVLYWSVPPDVAQRKLRRRLLFYACCILGLVVTFALGNEPSPTQHFAAEHADSGFVAAFLFIYVVVQISYLGDVALVAWRFAKVAERLWVRRGGAPQGEEAVSALIVMIASLFLLSGWAVAAQESRLAAAIQWLEQYRVHRQLYPLWRAFYDAIPAIALAPPANRWQAVWSPRHVRFRLLRRIIEIRDGQMNIRTYVDPRADLADSDDVEQEAANEARRIRVGLAALKRNQTPAHGADMSTPAGFAEITAEMRWLAQVAKAFAAHQPHTGNVDPTGPSPGATIHSEIQPIPQNARGT
jgi:hypothetical protein